MLRVLVLEDDPAMQKLLQKQLEAHGFAVIVAKNGIDGLAHLEETIPDVILCDVNMPHMDGFGFVEAMRANERARNVPIVFLTASSDEKDFQRAMKVGARYYITKPFSVKELVWKLNRVCGDGESA